MLADSFLGNVGAYIKVAFFNRYYLFRDLCFFSQIRFAIDIRYYRNVG